MNGQPENYNLIKKFMRDRKKPGCNVTGVYEKLHITKSLNVMHDIIGLKKIAVIVDNSPTGKAIKLQIEKEISQTPSSVQIVYFQLDSFEKFKRKVIEINSDEKIGAIYPVTTTLKAANRSPVNAKEIFTWLLANSKKPEIALNYFFSRLGMFGGAAVDFFAMGEQAGSKAAAILKGTPAGELSIDDAYDLSLVFNLERSKDLGITIPIDVLSAADIIYEDILLRQNKKRVKLLIIQSYEKGIGCGSIIEKGFVKCIAKAGYQEGQLLDLYHHYMDTQLNHTTETAIKRQARIALTDVRKIDPDIVVLLDDNAFKYVLPSLVNSKYAVLFSGTNVPLENYNRSIGFMNSREKPGKNVTGVTEEHELVQSLRLIKALVPGAENAVTIYSDSCFFLQEMAKANEAYIAAHREELPINFLKPIYVNRFSDYKAVIKKYNNDPSVDIIYSFAPISLIKDNNSIASIRETVKWMSENQKKPGFSWMTNWVNFGYLASAGIDLEAAGEQLAKKAVQIIKGEKTGSIPIQKPFKYSIALNLDRAKLLGLTIPTDILEAAEIVCSQSSGLSR